MIVPCSAGLWIAMCGWRKRSNPIAPLTRVSLFRALNPCIASAILLALQFVRADTLAASELSALIAMNPKAVAQVAPTPAHERSAADVPVNEARSNAAPEDAKKPGDDLLVRRRSRGAPKVEQPTDPQAAPIEGQKDLIDVVQPRRR